MFDKGYDKHILGKTLFSQPLNIMATNKSVLLVPADIQTEIDELVRLEGQPYNSSALTALRRGLKELIGPAKIREAVKAAGPSPLKPEPVRPPAPKKEPREEPAEASIKPARTRRFTTLSTEGDFTGNYLTPFKPQSSKLTSLIGCSVCGVDIKVTAEEFNDLRFAKEKTGLRPRCAKCGDNKEILRLARA
jgi:hypothetical protein